MKFFLSLILIFSLGSCVDPSNSSSNPAPNPPGIVSKFFENDHFIVQRYKESNKKSYIRFMMKSGTVSLTNRDLLTLLGAKEDDTMNGPSGKALRDAFTKSIANLEGKGIQLKSAVITSANKAEPYYFLAMLGEKFDSKPVDTYKDYFFHCEKKLTGASNTAIETFGFKLTPPNEFISIKNSSLTDTLKDGAFHFLSTSSSKTPLISPCPFEADITDDKNKPLVHLKAYMEAIKDNKNRQLSFWSAVASVATEKLAASPKTVLLNTHGHAVNYLHFRVESSTTYYSSYMDLTTEAGATATYKRVFK